MRSVAGSDPVAAGLQQRPAGGGNLGQQQLGRHPQPAGQRGRIGGFVQYVAALEIAAQGHVEITADRLGVLAQELLDLVQVPDVVLALHPFRIRVLGGVEPALRAAHFREHVVERAPGNVQVALVAGQLPGVQVAAGKLGVVVEHFFKMRDEPDRIDRVAVESAAEVIEYPAQGHPVERPQRRLQGRPVAGLGEASQQEVDRHRHRELGLVAPAAVLVVESGADRGRRAHGQALGQLDAAQGSRTG